MSDSTIEVRWSSGETDGENGVAWFGDDLQGAEGFAQRQAGYGWEVLLIEWAPDMVTARQERTF